MPSVDLTIDLPVISNSFNQTIGNLVADDSSVCLAMNDGEKGQVLMTSLPPNAGSINSIRWFWKDCYVENRGARVTMEVLFEDADTGGDYYTETIMFSDSMNDYSGIERTTSDGSNKWTIAQVNNLRVQLAALSNIGGYGAGAQGDYFFVRVDYETAGLPSHEPDIKLTSGKMVLSSGKVKVISL